MPAADFLKSGFAFGEEQANDLVLLNRKNKLTIFNARLERAADANTVRGLLGRLINIGQFRNSKQLVPVFGGFCDQLLTPYMLKVDT